MIDRDRDRDRSNRPDSDRSHYQRDSRPQDSKPHKHHDARNQNAQPYKHKSQKYQEDWTDRTRDRDHAWSRGRDRRSRSPTRFGYQQEVGRLSPTPYEPAYRTNWRQPARDERDDEDKVPSVQHMRVDEDPGDAAKAKLEAQIAALTKEELGFEIDLLIRSAKRETGFGAHPAHKMMEMDVGVSGGDEMDAEYGRLGRYEDMKVLEQMEDSDEDVYGPVFPTAPSFAR